MKNPIKRSTLLFLLLFSLLFSLFASIGGGLYGLGNKDIITMTKAGLSEDTIVLAIQNEEKVELETGAEELIKLKEANVSDAIIKAMITRNSGQQPNASTVTSQTPANKIVANQASSKDVMPPVVAAEKGQTYYTRVNFWHEKGKSHGTNYSRGTLVPVNTEVELISIRRNSFELRLPDGSEVKVINKKAYTGVDTDELATRYLAKDKTKIELYGNQMAKQISSGTMRLGMTKDQVLITRGYPPSHETASLDSDQWVYWSSRFVKRTLVFQGNRLVQGRGLR